MKSAAYTLLILFTISCAGCVTPTDGGPGWFATYSATAAQPESGVGEAAGQAITSLSRGDWLGAIGGGVGALVAGMIAISKTNAVIRARNKRKIADVVKEVNGQA